MELGGPSYFADLKQQVGGSRTLTTFGRMTHFVSWFSGLTSSTVRAMPRDALTRRQ